MRELPDEKTLDELLELAKDFEQKAQDLYVLATEIDEKWRIRLELRRTVAIQQSSQTKYDTPSKGHSAESYSER